MKKAAYVLSVLIGIVIANSCTISIPGRRPRKGAGRQRTRTEAAASGRQNYGSYLAGRVAHIRHDLNKAADYYKDAVAHVPDKQMLPSQLYIMLTSQGRIDEAVRYAQMAREKGDESPFIYTIEAINLTKHGKYQEAIDTIARSDNPIADTFFNPLISAWSQRRPERPAKSP